MRRRPGEIRLIFDASDYYRFTDAKAARKRAYMRDTSTGLPRILFMAVVFGVGLVMIVMNIEEVLASRSNTLMFILFLAAVVIVAIAAYDVSRPLPPLRVSADGNVILGRRSFPVESVARIRYSQRHSDIAIERVGKRLPVYVEGGQVGNLDEFLKLLKDRHPSVQLAAMDVPRKVRIPKDSV